VGKEITKLPLANYQVLSSTSIIITFVFNELLNMMPVDNILLCVIYFHYPKKSFSWRNHSGLPSK